MRVCTRSARMQSWPEGYTWYFRWKKKRKRNKKTWKLPSYKVPRGWNSRYCLHSSGVMQITKCHHRPHRHIDTFEFQFSFNFRPDMSLMPTLHSSSSSQLQVITKSTHVQTSWGPEAEPRRKLNEQKQHELWSNVPEVQWNAFPINTLISWGS